MGGFKELWMEMRSLHLLTPALPFSCLYSPVERKPNQQPPQFAFILGFWERKRAKALSKDKKEEKGLEGDPSGQRLYLQGGSFSPGQMVLFPRSPSAARAKGHTSRRQNSGVHPSQAQLIPSSTTAPFFALHPQRDTLLAVGSGQLQLDSSTSQMRAPRHLHVTELHTSYIPLPIWQELYQSLTGIPGNRYPKYKCKFHFILKHPCSGPITTFAWWKLKSCSSLKARRSVWSLQCWDPNDL